MKKWQILGWLALFSTATYADNCENPRNTYDDIYCVNKIFASADSDLNKSYKELRQYLSNDQKTILKRSQVAWIKDRDINCSSESKGAVYVNCNTEKTIERNAWLRERIRECKTIGCKTNSLR